MQARAVHDVFHEVQAQAVHDETHEVEKAAAAQAILRSSSALQEAEARLVGLKAEAAAQTALPAEALEAIAMDS